jgi:hypothetical protein
LERVKVAVVVVVEEIVQNLYKLHKLKLIEQQV